MIGEPALEGSLSGWRLAGARGHDVTHDALVYDVGFDARSRDRLPDDQGSEFRGW